MVQAAQQHRDGETGHFPFRSDRIYFSGDAWYFLIRGGQSKGPYSNLDETKLALQHYIHTLNNLNRAFHMANDDEHTVKPQHKTSSH